MGHTKIVKLLGSCMYDNGVLLFMLFIEYRVYNQRRRHGLQDLMGFTKCDSAKERISDPSRSSLSNDASSSRHEHRRLEGTTSQTAREPESPGRDAVRQREHQQRVVKVWRMHKRCVLYLRVLLA